MSTSAGKMKRAAGFPIHGAIAFFAAGEPVTWAELHREVEAGWEHFCARRPWIRRGRPDNNYLFTKHPE